MKVQSKKIAFGILVLLMVAITAYAALAYSVYEWDNGQECDSFQFNGSNNFSTYLSLPTWMNISVATVNLTGHIGAGLSSVLEDFETGSVPSEISYDANMDVDVVSVVSPEGGWGSYVLNVSGLYGSSANLTFTGPTNSTNISFYFKFNGSNTDVVRWHVGNEYDDYDGYRMKFVGNQILAIGQNLSNSNPFCDYGMSAEADWNKVTIEVMNWAGKQRVNYYCNDTIAVRDWQWYGAGPGNITQLKMEVRPTHYFLVDNITYNSTGNYPEDVTLILNNSLYDYNGTGSLNGLASVNLNQGYLESYYALQPNLTFTYTSTADGNLTVCLKNITYVTHQYENIVVANLVYNGSVNWTRNMTYDINLSCNASNANISIWVNDTSVKDESVLCINTVARVQGSYNNSFEGMSNIAFYLNTTDPHTNKFFGNTTLYWDLYDPVANSSFTVDEGFSSNQTTNVSLVCTDTIYSPLEYNVSFNGVHLSISNLTNNTQNWTTTELQDGFNYVYGTCKDLFGSNTMNYSSLVQTKSIIIIDERNGTAFDVSNLSNVRVYFDDNSTSHDFKSAGSAQINFTGEENTKLRFELEYITGDIITRYVDSSVYPFPELRVCANKEGVTHYEQLILSTSQRRAVLQSVFANCTVAADYTRFAYQDSFILKAYTIATRYYLYVWDGDVRVTLASLDGSIASYVNLDVLEFNREGVDISILGDTISIERDGGSQVKIYYLDLAEDNVQTTMSIYRMDTNALLYSGTETTSPNEFVVYFNWATLSNITNTTLFKVNVTGVDVSGNSNTATKYFTTNASSGNLQNVFAVVFSAILFLFGITFVASRLSFSWFGIFMCIGAIAVLSFAVGAWYITFMQVVYAVVMVYVVIVMWQQNQPTFA